MNTCHSLSAFDTATFLGYPKCSAAAPVVSAVRRGRTFERIATASEESKEGAKGEIGTRFWRSEERTSGRNWKIRSSSERDFDMGGAGERHGDVITLKGSAAIVREFFCYAVNSILFQRGVYPSENFGKVKKYGLTLLICDDEKVKTFINTVTGQIAEWLEKGAIERLVLIVASIASKEVLERWSFNIDTDKEVTEKGLTREKSDKDIMADIQAIMRQIASSISFLPNLDEPCVFDLLAYTRKDAEVPPLWGESDARLINNQQVVKLRTVDTKVHRVDALVAYKFES